MKGNDTCIRVLSICWNIIQIMGYGIKIKIAAVPSFLGGWRQIRFSDWLSWLVPWKAPGYIKIMHQSQADNWLTSKMNDNWSRCVCMFACAMAELIELSLCKSSVSLPMMPISDHYTRGLSVECIPPTTLLVSNGCAKSNVVNSSPAHALPVPRILLKSTHDFPSYPANK